MRRFGDSLCTAADHLAAIGVGITITARSTHLSRCLKAVFEPTS